VLQKGMLLEVTKSLDSCSKGLYQYLRRFWRTLRAHVWQKMIYFCCYPPSVAKSRRKKNSNKKSILPDKYAGKVVEKLIVLSILRFDMDHFNMCLTECYRDTTLTNQQSGLIKQYQVFRNIAPYYRIIHWQILYLVYTKS